MANIANTPTKSMHRSPSNRGMNRRPLSDADRAELVQRHDMLDREEASQKFPNTKRFVCCGCRYSTNDANDAKVHREWIRRKFEEDGASTKQGPEAAA